MNQRRRQSHRRMARSHRVFTRGPRRLTNWIGPADQEYVTVSAGTKVIIASLDPDVANMVRPTIVRTRGNVSIKTNVATALTFVGAFGVGVVSNDAFAAGVASIPGPFSDADWHGWFVWRSFSYSQIESGTGANVWQNHLNVEVDSKAMRRVSTNETVVLIAESQDDTFGISMPLRMLFKLS